MTKKKKGTGTAPMRSVAASLPAHRLWGACIVICIVLFFSLAVFWLAVEAGLLPAPGARSVQVLEFAELCAIAVFAIELFSRYRMTPDKKKFLAENWLAIVAILPIGIFVRGVRMFEGAGLLRPLKLAEADFLVPAVAVSARPLLSLQKWLAHFQVFRDFFALVRAWGKGIFG